MQRPTISDVAREAQVSKATVSRVLNNVPNVADELRKRVQDAIDKLDYQPSRAARSLKKNLQDVIGFLIPSITDTIFGAVLRGAEDLAYENKIGILPYSTADDLVRQQMYLDFLQTEQVAGIVLVPAPGTDVAMLASLQAQGIAIVLLDRKLDGFNGDCIASDNFQGAYMATKHLIDLGYTRIATIAGSQNVSTGFERLNGYRSALADAHLSIEPDLVCFGNFDRTESRRAMDTLLAHKNHPEAVFVSNDEMMIGALQALQACDVVVPDEIAIVAFDELPLSGLLTPPLTTIEQSTVDLGHEAFRILLERIQEPERTPRIVQIPPRLIVRQSCGSQ